MALNSKQSKELEYLLQDHPNWSHLRKILQFGASFPLLMITQEECITAILFHIERGNRKSAQKNKISLDNLISKDVNIGFTLPIWIDTIKMLPNASLAPLVCIKQTSINKEGEKLKNIEWTLISHFQAHPGFQWTNGFRQSFNHHACTVLC